MPCSMLDVCAGSDGLPPLIVSRVLWGTEQSAGTARPRHFSIFGISVFPFSFAELSSRDAAH